MQASKNLGSIWPNRSWTAFGAKSGEAVLTIAPMLSAAMANIAASELFGVQAATRSPEVIPMALNAAAHAATDERNSP